MPGVDPATWPPDERAAWLAREQPLTGRPTEVTARRGMVVGTSNPFAAHAGREMLAAGGSAADAALATALAQIALWGGAAVSYAGVLNAVCYDAATGRTETLNACYDTVRGETDPTSIPEMGQASGRSALTPGFMAGVQALHDRYGRRSFADLFQAAIWIAEEGTKAGVIAAWLKASRTAITRLPETRAIFTRPGDDQLYEAHDLFRQPALAATLRKVAAEGAGYMYGGEWARRCVAAVQRDGGKLSLSDLRNYRPIWSEPLRLPYRDFELATMPPPNIGGAVTLGSLKVVERANLKRLGLHADSPEALYALIKISRALLDYGYLSPSMREVSYPALTDTSERGALSDAFADTVWARVKAGMQAAAPTPTPEHSAGVVAADERGNVVALLHSCNCVMWGATGLFVDGISIPDSACFQQVAIGRAGPGARLPDPTNPLIVLRQGKPFLASSVIGAGLHADSLQNLVAVLDHGLTPQQAGDLPKTQGPYQRLISNDGYAGDYQKEAVTEGDFPDATLDAIRALGQPIEVQPQPLRLFNTWIGLQIDGGLMRSGVDSYFPGPAEGW